jgi:hypothetical protein
MNRIFVHAPLHKVSEREGRAKSRFTLLVISYSELGFNILLQTFNACYEKIVKIATYISSPVYGYV